MGDMLGTTLKNALTSCDKNKLWVEWSTSTAFQATDMNAEWQHDKCASCPAGEKRDATTSGCIGCAPGQHTVTENVRYECDACGTGKYSGAATSGACVNCIAGKYNDQTGKDACVSCTLLGANRFQSTAGQTSCSECAKFMKPTRVADACTCVEPCPRGKYGTSPSCTDCPTGKFFVAIGARVAEDCGNCPLGTWSETPGASSLAMCIGCPAGTKGTLGGQATLEAGCSSCIAGESYQDQTGTTVCVYRCYRGRCAADGGGGTAAAAFVLRVRRLSTVYISQSLEYIC